jgi:hypothetical protein
LKDAEALRVLLGMSQNSFRPYKTEGIMRYGLCLIGTVMDIGVALIREVGLEVGGELRSGQIRVLIRSAVPYSHSGHELYTLERLG